MSNVFTETLRQIAQQNANRSQAQYSESCAGVIRCKASGLGQTIEWAVESPRAMTAEDLGLPGPRHEVWTSQPMMDFAAAQRELRIWSGKDWRLQESPYKFWLGAAA